MPAQFIPLASRTMPSFRRGIIFCSSCFHNVEEIRSSCNGKSMGATFLLSVIDEIGRRNLASSVLSACFLFFRFA